MFLQKAKKINNKVYRRLVVSLSIIFLVFSLLLFSFGAHQKNNNKSFSVANFIYDSRFSMILSIISIIVSFILYVGSFLLREEAPEQIINKEPKEDVEYYEIQRKPKMEITFTQRNKNHHDGESEEINTLLIVNDYE